MDCPYTNDASLVRMLDAPESEWSNVLDKHIRACHLSCYEGHYLDLPIPMYKQSLLHLAVRTGHDALVAFLLAHNVNVNSHNINHETPLHVAVRCNKEDIAQSLIDHGADRNAHNMLRMTPLQLAQYYKNDLVTLLNVNPIDRRLALLASFDE